MAQKNIEVQINKREPGKSTSRSLRRQMRTPGVVYGASIDSAAIEADERDVMKYHQSKFENAIITLKSDDANLNNLPVLMKKVDIHPVTRKPTHVDFHALNMKAKITVEVEVKTEGTAKGLANGGTLQITNRHIEVECMPTSIPENITVDVSALDVGDVIHVSDISLPANVVAISAPDMAVVTVSAPQTEEAEAAAPATE